VDFEQISPWFNWADTGITIGLLGFLFWLFRGLFGGKIVPLSTLNFLKEERDARLREREERIEELREEADIWIQAYRQSEENQKRTIEQLEKLLGWSIESTEILTAVQQALQEVLVERRK
jgi:hypothetical protein